MMKNPKLHSNGIGLTDNHGRNISYLRLSITDRCNLRCRYCRPEEGVPFVPHEEILTFEELERLTGIFCSLGIRKVRVTGGEPFARRGCLQFLQRLRKTAGVESLHLTTNGVETGSYLDALAELPIDSINLSLDSLDRERFRDITRRDRFEEVMLTLQGIIERRIPLKINSVILEDTDDEEILNLAQLAREFPVTVRFIEKMPFSGKPDMEKLPVTDIHDRLMTIIPCMKEKDGSSISTARIFSVPGFMGEVGIIEGYSRGFCSTCNKLRITPTGMLKTCLYDDGVLDLRKMLREGRNEKWIKEDILNCIQERSADGHKAEQTTDRLHEPSMANIGG